MIKNELFDNLENMKRKLVQHKIMEEDENIKKITHHGHIHKLSKEVKPVVINDTIQEKEETVTKDDKKNVEIKNDQKSDDCDNSLTCADFKEEHNMKHKGFEKDNMKELYDFVFDDDKKQDLLEKQFNTSTTQVTEKNEVELHHEIKSKMMKETNDDVMKCNFEIIGNIEEDNENDVVGLDYLSQNAFAKMI